ncbi:MAG TPA: hypothetical protein VIH57_03285 [Bacteroidales bacterium]
MEVLVFKTNIYQKQDIEKVRPFFNDYRDILKWHVDIDDEDCVLRIEAQENIVGKIQNLVQDAGYWCAELQ